MSCELLIEGLSIIWGFFTHYVCTAAFTRENVTHCLGAIIKAT